ncbi:MAG: NUDIX hydrolase [Planctomycetota bacterium]
MHRRHLTELLVRYAAAWPAEVSVSERFLAFIGEHDDCLHRSCVPGHITASAWILSPDGNSALLTHHKKLGRWLQLGGHVDGEVLVEQAALREAIEESGMTEFEFVRWGRGPLVPLDLDVHAIPARGREPLHEHWDVRFLLRAGPGQQIVRSDESNELRWVAAGELTQLTQEESVLRLARKARAIGAH